MNNPSPLVSVIVPAYNAELTIALCLSSVLAQTYCEFEIIVVDDCSNDNTAEEVYSLLQGEPKKILMCSTLRNSKGPATPRNLGVSLASGYLVAFLDADDFWIPTKLERCVNEWLKTGADLIYHHLHEYRFDKKNRVPLKNKKKISAGEVGSSTDSLLWSGNQVPLSSILARRGAILAVGGFDTSPRLVAAEDYDFLIRLQKAGFGMYKIDKCLGYYSSDSGLSQFDLRTNTTYILEKYGLETNLEKCPMWAARRLVMADLRDSNCRLCWLIKQLIFLPPKRIVRILLYSFAKIQLYTFLGRKL